MTAGMRTKLSVALAVAASVALVIAANWQFVNLAVSSNPGCVPVEPSRSAAKPGC